MVNVMRILPRLSLRQFFLVITISLSVVGVSVFGYLWWLDLRLNEASESMASAVSNIRLAQQLQIDLLAHKRNLLLAELTDSEERWERVMQLTDSLREDANALRRVAKASLHPNLTTLERGIYEYLATQDRLQRSGYSPLERFNRATPDFDAAFFAADTVAKLNTKSADEDQREVLRSGDFAKWTGLALAFCIFGIVATILFSLNRLLFRPLSHLNRAISHVSRSGELEVLPLETGASDVGQIATAFNRMTRRLQDQEEFRARMIAAIAHDIRSPIGSMQMSVELLLDETESTAEERRTFLKILHGQIKTLLTLASDLTDMSAIHGGNLQLKSVVTDLGDLVSQAASFFRLSAKRHSISLEVGDEPISARVDPSRLSQVLNNIIGNAIKYSPQGGRIQISVGAVGSSVVISVSDQGEGIPSGELESIFEPFHRSSGTRDRIPGLGLGLATSRKLVRAMKGDLKVESRPGHGSTFSIVLPREREVPNSEVIEADAELN